MKRIKGMLVYMGNLYINQIYNADLYGDIHHIVSCECCEQI